MRPAIDAFQQHHVHLVQQFFDTVNNLDAVLFVDRGRELLDAIGAGRQIGTAALNAATTLIRHPDAIGTCP